MPRNDTMRLVQIYNAAKYGIEREHLTDTFYYFKFTPQVLSSFNASQSALERLIPEVIDNED